MAGNRTTMKIKIVGGDHGTGIVTGVGTHAKPGDVVELDRWTAMHVCQASGVDCTPIAVPYEGKGGK